MNLDIKIVPLAKIPNRYNELLNLIEECFHYSNENKFELDFLPLVHPTNWENCHLIFNEENLIGHIGFQRKNLIFKNEILNCAFIGGICIKKDYQGKGIFQHSMKYIIDKIKDVALIFLWSGHGSGYKKFHFYETGRVYQTGNNLLISLPEFNKLKMNQLSNEIKELIIASYNQTSSKFISPQRSNHDWEIIFQMSSIDVYHMRDLNSFSYFFTNKGQDLNGVIHEFGAIDLTHENKLIEKLIPFKLWSPIEIVSSHSTALFLANIRIQNKMYLTKWIDKVELKIDTQLNDEDLLSAIFNSDEINFYIPGCDSI